MVRSSRIRLFAPLALILSVLPVLGLGMSKPAAAAGEEWYGTIEWRAVGTKKLNDGSTYTSNEVYTLTLPESDLAGTVHAVINSTIVHPDPLPDAANCWLQRETWSGVARVPAELYVDVSSPYFRMQVTSLSDSATGRYRTEYAGGTVDGRNCADSNGSTSFGIYPGATIHSWSYARPTFRGGRNFTPDRTYIGGCPFYGNGTEECTEGYNAGNWVPAFRARWSIAAKECTGYSKSYRLGDGDTLLVFNPCQTRSLSSRISYLDQIDGAPKVCDYAFSKRTNRVCDGYKAISRVIWARNDWFFSNAANNGNCGVWVLDRAPWRKPKITSAKRAADGQSVVSITPGNSARIRTADGGSLSVSCP